jgi:hypothetical protein
VRDGEDYQMIKKMEHGQSGFNFNKLTDRRAIGAFFLGSTLLLSSCGTPESQATDSRGADDTPSKDTSGQTVTESNEHVASPSPSPAAEQIKSDKYNEEREKLIKIGEYEPIDWSKAPDSPDYELTTPMDKFKFILANGEVIYGAGALEDRWTLDAPSAIGATRQYIEHLGEFANFTTDADSQSQYDADPTLPSIGAADAYINTAFSEIHHTDQSPIQTPEADPDVFMEHIAKIRSVAGNDAYFAIKQGEDTRYKISITIDEIKDGGIDPETGFEIVYISGTIANNRDEFKSERIRNKPLNQSFKGVITLQVQKQSTDQGTREVRQIANSSFTFTDSTTVAPTQ